MQLRGPHSFTMFLVLIATSTVSVDTGKAANSPPDERAVSSTAAPQLPMRDLIERYSADIAALRRSESIPGSTKRWNRFRRFYEDQLGELQSIDFDTLDQAGRIDYLLFNNELQFQLRQLQYERERTSEIEQFLPFAAAIIELAEARRRMHPMNPADSAKTLSRIAMQAEEIRRTFEREAKEQERKPRFRSKVPANRAAQRIDALRTTLRQWHDFYAGYHPEFTWWASERFKAADRELNEYASLLRKEIVGVTNDDENAPIIGDPIGREALIDALAAEMIPYSPEELVEIANEEFAWCEAEYRKASRELGFEDDWRKALDYVSQKHAKPGEQPEIIKMLAQEAVDFLEQRELVTIPELAKEIWRMEMMTPERQRVNPFFTGGEVISVSYPTAEMSYADKVMGMRGNNVHFSRATVHHELIPGHHLQGFMAQRYRTYRQPFRTPFLVEGWPLYWEMLLWDLGFPKTAEDRIGFLFWRSHRCARIIFSLNFHLGKMTPQECIDFLVERVGHERRNATGEVRRSFSGAYPPLYQAAYLLGGLQIRALHRDLVQSGRMSHREFHDGILQENAIPVEMIRASLINQPLTRDFKPAWRFYVSADAEK